MGFNEYIHEVIKRGNCTFSIEDALNHLNKSRKAIRSSIEHWLARKELVSPAKGFYVIVPPEYQILGCIPAEYFIPYLMEYWKSKYYACLLTAAKYHGATHQAVMIFQVMTEKPRPPISCGRIKVKFITNKKLDETPTQNISTRMSILNVSTPEGTAMDLLTYPHQSAGLNHVITVLTELHETMQPDKLLALAKNSNVLAWQQRLGFMLEMINADKLAEALNKRLSEQNRVDYIPLATGRKIKKNDERNPRWKIIENIKLESDI